MTFYRRNLPHWHPDGKAIFITWRLFGSLPKGVAPGGSHWAMQRTSDPATLGCATGSTATPGCEKSRTGRSACVTESTGRSACATGKRVVSEAGKEFRRMDAQLDKGLTGPLWLRDPRIGTLVEKTIFRGEQLKQYELDTYVVMPNHVHVLLWPWVLMERITGGIKGVSARDANRALGRVGMHFWAEESFDHWIRNDAELRRVRTYIERNPVTAGLVRNPEDWPWSSAAKRIRDTATPGGETGSTATPGCAGETTQAGVPVSQGLSQAGVPVLPEKT